MQPLAKLKTEAYCVSPKHLQFMWPRVSPMLKTAMQRGDLGTFEELEADVLNERALLWLAWNCVTIEGVAVSQIAGTERGKCCFIVACAGQNAWRWLHLLEKIEQYAKAEGCRATRIIGRKGWARMLPEYQSVRVVLEKELK
jgi:hypothetical protein